MLDFLGKRLTECNTLGGRRIHKKPGKKRCKVEIGGTVTFGG